MRRLSARSGTIHCATVVSAICVLALSIKFTVAGEPQPDAASPAADELVVAALRAEAAGNDDLRARLLAQALSADPQHDKARWHSGYVRLDGDWRLVDASEPSARQQEYRQRRATADLDVRGHYTLAAWCGRNGLSSQQEAHLLAALEMDGSNRSVRRALGYFYHDGEWIQRDQLQQARQRQQAYRHAMRRWQRPLVELAERIGDGGETEQIAARDELIAIDDPYAIPMMEACVSVEGPLHAAVVVDALHAIRSDEATLGLARHAVLAPWMEVRGRAADSLAGRHPYEYLPLLVSAMYGRVRVENEVRPLADGRTLHQVMLLREGFAAHEAEVFETYYQPSNDPHRDQRNLDRLVDTSNDRHSARVDQLNLQTRQLNERVAWVLTRVTQQDLGTEPQAWWDYWVAYTDYAAPEKQLQVASYRSESRPLVTSGSCFVAGTPVWTCEGPQAIETLQVGDLVLSQDVATGELSYQPVVRTTSRRAPAMVKLTVDDEQLVTTAGHGFWVNGVGWTRARDLEPGSLLHTTGGAKSVSATDPSETAWVFNLVVDDTHTYFVGSGRYLVHDNNLFKPARMIVPGLPVE